MRRTVTWFAPLVMLVAAGCAGDEQPCETNLDCPGSQICRYDQCLEADWTDESPSGAPDATSDASMPDTEPAVEGRLRAPDTLSFDDPGTRRTFELTNAGEATLTLESHEVAGGPFSVTRLELDGTDRDIELPRELPPGDTLLVHVEYDATEPGTDRGSLTFRSDAANSPTTVDLVGRHGGCLEVEPADEMAFGLPFPDRSTTRQLELSNCGDRAPVEFSMRLTDNGDGAFGFQSPGDGAVLQPDERLALPVTFEPDAVGTTYEARIVVETNLPGRERITVDLVGTVGGDCPEPDIETLVAGTDQPVDGGEVSPGTDLLLDASGSEPNEAIEGYQWSIISTPGDAQTNFRPDNNVPAPEVSLDFAGVWTFELTLEGHERWRDCDPATVEVRTVPEEDIYVEMTWRTPGDNNPGDNRGADLDLHYLNPKASSWNEAPWDIYWRNETADWGNQSSSADDPELSSDASRAPGPEAVTHDNLNPALNGSGYTIGAHYYAPNDFGPSYATVRIFVRGELARSFQDRRLAEAGDFWKVAVIDWPSGNIYERDEMYDGFPQLLR